MPLEEEGKEEEPAPSADTVAVNLSNTVEISFNLDGTDDADDDTLTFTAISDAIISTEENYEDDDDFEDIIVTNHSSLETQSEVEELDEKEEEPIIVDYTEVMESLNMEENMVAEKRDMWEPIRRLLDRRKFGVTGYSEDL